MPKKKSSRPAASLGSNQISEPKSASQIKRERIVRIAAITIVLALLLSLLAGAFSVTPSQAATPGLMKSQSAGFRESVQILQADDSPTGGSIDTDGDGIINNEDPDIDGDGIVNANDGDIDGDGISNFEDGDPAATNGIDGDSPKKPGSVSLADLAENGSLFWIMGVGLAVLVTLGLILAKTLKKRGKKAKKNF
jgi:hypothetical protein